MAAYYNEWDAYAAQWLRNLIDAGELPAGDVDERSIRDVLPRDLDGYTQCHFFAGISGWPLALRMAGWPDDRPVWTGSCPCQPFSSAGKRQGTDDDRHLWPDLFRLFRECGPSVIMGEQVASKDGLAWLDLVSADLEDEGYTFRAADLCAAGVGAPHLRQRLFWVGYSNNAGPQGHGARAQPWEGRPTAEAGPPGGLGHSKSKQREWGGIQLQPGRPREEGADVGGDGAGGGRGDPNSEPAGRDGRSVPQAQAQGSGERVQPRHQLHRPGDAGEPSPWANPDWVFCNDPGGPRWRPVEPGLEPLAPRLPGDVGKLRAYGNSIVPQVAAQFIGAYLDTQPSFD